MAGLRLSLQASDKRLKVAGSTLLGVFARATEKIVLVPPETREETIEALEEGLKVSSLRMAVAGSSVLGSLVCGNSNGFVLTSQADRDDLQKLSEYGRVTKLPGKINAAGNVILANDNAALAHPGLSKRACDAMSKTLGVKVVQGTIGGLKTVGMAAIATNKGILVHPRTSEVEIAMLEAVFDLPVDVGTVNFGSPLVGSGILANSNGYFAGDETSGPELGRIEDALGFLV
jgi:translation initiation factor 6